MSGAHHRRIRFHSRVESEKRPIERERTSLQIVGGVVRRRKPPLCLSNCEGAYSDPRVEAKRRCTWTLRALGARGVCRSFNLRRKEVSRAICTRASAPDIRYQLSWRARNSSHLNVITPGDRATPRGGTGLRASSWAVAFYLYSPLPAVAE